MQPVLERGSIDNALTNYGEQGRKKQGKYRAYHEVLRARIGRYATENGNKAAVETFLLS